MNAPEKLRVVGRCVRRDAVNVTRYGWRAPRFAQRIWVDPMACDLAASDLRRSQSGQVIGGDWDRRLQVWEEVHRVPRFCRRHWEEGISWEEAGAYDYLERIIARSGRRRDGSLTRDDVVARYDRLDALFEQVRREGRLRSQAELPGLGFREFGGVVVHIGRSGEPIFSKKGNHRFAIARILRLPVIPAQLGVVHSGAIDRWHQHLRHELEPSFP